MRRAHEFSSGAGLLIDMRKGEPTTSLGLANKAFKGRTPEARSCHTLLVCQSAHCRMATRFHIFPGVTRGHPFRQSIQGGRDARTVAADHLHSPLQTPRVGDLWVCAVGAWGNLCQANLPYEGQTAAHGQITERKSSVARFRFSLVCGRATYEQSVLNSTPSKTLTPPVPAAAANPPATALWSQDRQTAPPGTAPRSSPRKT